MTGQLSRKSLLRMLAASADPVDTTVLAGVDGLRGRERQYVLTRTGTVLRTLERLGLVRRARILAFLQAYAVGDHR